MKTDGLRNLRYKWILNKRRCSMRLIHGPYLIVVRLINIGVIIIWSICYFTFFLTISQLLSDLSPFKIKGRKDIEKIESLVKGYYGGKCPNVLQPLVNIRKLWLINQLGENGDFGWSTEDVIRRWQSRSGVDLNPGTLSSRSDIAPCSYRWDYVTYKN